MSFSFEHHPGQPHETQIAFGYPDSLIHAYEYWSVQLRPKQTTLGALVLICHEDARAFSAISAKAGAELPFIVRDVERVLSQLFSYDKINWLMLMMVDPHVHFHILPRYSTARSYENCQFTDPGWPGQPDLSYDNACPYDVRSALITHFRKVWPL